MTWGNVSGIDRQKGLVVIKPSGIDFENMTDKDMIVVDLHFGKVQSGKHNPSSDTATHLELYRSFPEIRGIVHTHSRWATIFAQTEHDIIPLGTTHGDCFYGTIPCTRPLTAKEISSNYELETGKVIVETFKDKNPNEIPAVLVARHAPFIWGTSPLDAIYNAVALEEIALMAWNSQLIEPLIVPIPKELMDKTWGVINSSSFPQHPFTPTLTPHFSLHNPYPIALLSPRKPACHPIHPKP